MGNGRAPIEKDLSKIVGLNQPETVVGADYLSKQGSKRIYIKLDTLGKRFISINNEPIKTIKNIDNDLCIDFISADILHIFQNYSDFRRRDLNKFGGKLTPSYNLLNSKYDKIIKHKNKLLKEKSDKKNILIWTDQQLELGTQLVNERLSILSTLEKKLIEIKEKLDGVIPGSLTLNYKIKGSDAPINLDNERYSNWLESKLKNNIDKEIYAGMTLYGPHRDDFEIYIDKKPLTSWYSRGINRSFAVLLKYAQLLCLKDNGNPLPLLCIDDAFAEIDHKVKAKLFDIIQEDIQVFYTSVLESDYTFIKDGVKLKMTNGCLTDV